MESKPRRLLHWGATSYAEAAAKLFRERGLECEVGPGIGVVYMDMTQPGAPEALRDFQANGPG